MAQKGRTHHLRTTPLRSSAEAMVALLPNGIVSRIVKAGLYAGIIDDLHNKYSGSPSKRSYVWEEADITAGHGSRVPVHPVSPGAALTCATPVKWRALKLSFTWANGAPDFSFDLGGVLMGDELAGQEFLAEVKFYPIAGASDQGTLYREYLAKCYRAFVTRPDRCNNFMWITWAPFLVTKWTELCSAKEVKSAVIEHCERTLNIIDETEASSAVDLGVCTMVAEKLWLIVLSERQEQLVISREHRGLIQQHIIARGHR